MMMRYSDTAALIARLSFGAMMAFGHGWGKLQKLISGDEIQFISLMGLPENLSLGLAVFAEFVACLFIMIGYKTRFFSIFIIITMLIAAFYVHSADALFMQNADGGGSKEPALLYLSGFVIIYLLDSGKYSLDDRLKILRT
jgi:putative oxidoreductase